MRNHESFTIEKAARCGCTCASDPDVCVCVFQTTVVSLRQTPDFSTTGQWEVETEGDGGCREIRIFDAVMVCSGHYSQPHLPLSDFPG